MFKYLFSGLIDNEMIIQQPEFKKCFINLDQTSDEPVEQRAECGNEIASATPAAQPGKGFLLLQYLVIYC